MILAFSLRPIQFQQDNYSVQFDPDNNSSCLVLSAFFFFCFVLSGIFFFLISLQLINHSKFITQPLNYEKI